MKSSAQILTGTFLLTFTFLLSPLALRADSVESNLAKTFAVEPGGVLVVDADRGPIEITTGPVHELKIEVLREVTGASEAKAREILADHKVTFEQNKDRVEVRGRLSKPIERSGWFGRSPNLQVQYKILVPGEFNLDLKTAAGSISVTDIKGKVKARSAGGSLKFATVEGPLEGTTSAGSITLDKAAGPATLSTSGGSIKIGETGADATLKTSAGSITIATAGAKLLAHTSGGSIHAGELHGPAELATAAGSIHVKVADANTEARTAGGSITVENAKAALVATTSAGSITAAFTAQPQEDCRLSTSGGHITVKIGEGVGFDVQAKCTGGRITTEIPVATTVVGTHHQGQLNGKLNDGGKALVLQSAAGSIKIEKL